MSKKKEKTLKDYLDELIAKGQYYFIVDEIKAKLKVQDNSLSVALSRLAKKKKIKTIKHGFGLILYAHEGELHPSHYLDQMMKLLNAKYYLGLLSAAAFWGASHQSSMSFQVVTNKIVKPIKFEKGRIEFVAKQISFPELGLQKVAGNGGYFLISSPELTAIDLLRFPKRSGHLNNVATILEELCEKWTKENMVKIFSDSSVPTVTLQRLGYLLDIVLKKEKEAGIVEKILAQKHTAPTLLSSSKKVTNLKSLSFNERWKLYINTTVEPD